MKTKEEVQDQLKEALFHMSNCGHTVTPIQRQAVEMFLRLSEEELSELMEQATKK